MVAATALGHAGQGRAVDRRLPRLRRSPCSSTSERRPRRAAPRPGPAAAEQWTPDRLVPGRLPGSPPSPSAAPPTPSTARRRCARWPPRRDQPEQFELLDRAAADDVDLAWRTMVRRAALGRYDADAVEALLARDPDPDARCGPSASPRPGPTRRPRPRCGTSLRAARRPAGLAVSRFAHSFWRPVQQHLLVPGPPLPRRGAAWAAAACSSGGADAAMMPATADEAFIERART